MRGFDIYIFKRGLVYRGSLTVTRGGADDQPIRLTSGPSWGQGEAVLAGSELATDWNQGADRDDIPGDEMVWYADINTKPHPSAGAVGLGRGRWYPGRHLPSG